MRALSTTLVILFAASCSNGDPTAPNGVAGSTTALIIDGSRIDVRVYAKERERRTALKGPLPPAEGGGNLFLFPTAAYRHLHSSKCPVTVTALFIAPNGTVGDIQDLPAYSDASITSEIEASSILLLRFDHAKALKLSKGVAVLPEEIVRNAAPDPLPSVTIDGKTIFVELASTEDERSRGLMHRPRMSRDHGMLFLYPSDRDLSFYMRNTLIPLTIAYIRDTRTIVDIFDMKPLDETSILSTVPARFALEANVGWFRERGIRPGDAVDFSIEIERLINE